MKYEFITTESRLESVSRNLLKEDAIGVDLEADAMHCFKEKICLIQIATARSAFLVDPFVVNDISSFVAVLENKDVVKIFHGSDFDIRSLDRDYNARVNNLFDTEIACRFTGATERGLAALLKAHFNVIADKRFQRVDWSRRPLKQDMIEYAVGDVSHLTRLRTILNQQLADRGRLAWAREEFEHQEQVRYEANNTRPLFVRIKGAGKLDNRSLAVLENLLMLRLELAEKKDRPLFKVISNPSLLAMAQSRPESVKQMVESKALSPKQARMYGDACLKAVSAALALARKDLPAYPRSPRPKKDPRVLNRVGQLKKMRERLSLSLEMEPGIVLNNALISTIANENPDTLEKLGQTSHLRRWQQEALGSDIMETLGRCGR